MLSCVDPFRMSSLQPSRPVDPDDRSLQSSRARSAPALPPSGSSPPALSGSSLAKSRVPPALPASGAPCPPVNRAPFTRPPALPASPIAFLSPFQAPLQSAIQLAPCKALDRSHGPRPLVPAKRPRPSKQDGTGMEAIRKHSAANSQVALALMSQLLAFLGSESSLFQSLENATHFAQHVRRILAGFAATTVIRYITTFNSFSKACEDLEVDILELSETQAADVLVTLALQREEDPAVGSSAVTCIKAVRWVHKHAQCSIFAIFYGELLSSFVRSKLPRDRRESVPLPLFALVQWERRILQRSTPLVDVFLLGSLLVTCWASLRFADSQRIEWRSFAFDVVSLRAVAYQTKTSHQGQPFGLITQGFLNHGSFTWVAKWLRVLDSIASQEIRDFGVAPSFLFPCIDEHGQLVRPLAPMSYASGLRWLRYYLRCPWLEDPPAIPVSNYTVHSLKCTFLSFMLEVPEIQGADKDAQGHHRGSSRELYSRDDVLGALRAQTQLRAAVLAGFRPRTPQHRGAQLPMQPIPFELEAFRKDIPDAPWGFFNFDVSCPGSLPWVPSAGHTQEASAAACAATTPRPPAAPLPMQDPPSAASVLSASEAASDTSSEAAALDVGPADEVHMIAATGVVHAAYSADADRTLCGINTLRSQWQPVLRLSARHTLCRRLACVNAFASLEVS